MHVVLADKQKDVVSALQFVLRMHHRDWEFFPATRLPELFQILALGCPDLLIIDWGMQALYERNPFPQVCGRNLFAAIHTCCSGLYTIVLDLNPETERLAMRWGANAFVCKADPPETLLLAIQALVK